MVVVVRGSPADASRNFLPDTANRTNPNAVHRSCWNPVDFVPWFGSRLCQSTPVCGCHRESAYTRCVRIWAASLAYVSQSAWFIRPKMFKKSLFLTNYIIAADSSKPDSHHKIAKLRYPDVYWISTSNLPVIWLTIAECRTDRMTQPIEGHQSLPDSKLGNPLLAIIS